MRIDTDPNPEDFRAACKAGGRPMEKMMRAVTLAYHKPLLRYSAFLCAGNATIAEEAVQLTLISIWRSCSTFATGNLLGWARTIVRHETFDLTQAVASRRQVPLEDTQGQVLPEAESAMGRASPAERPDDLASDAQHLALLETQLAHFEHDYPDHVRALYCAVLGMSGDEMAQELGRSPGATRELLSQARAKAAHYLRDWRERVHSVVASSTRKGGDGAAPAGEPA